MKTKKKATSYRLTPEAKSILQALARQLGLSQGGVLEMAIRDFHFRNGNSEKVKTRH